VQSRDVIYVPAKEFDWNLILRAVSTAALVGQWLID